MIKLTRRELLGAGIAGSATMFLGGRSPASSILNPKNLIIAWANGGWDPTFVFEIKPGLATVVMPTPAMYDTPICAVVVFADVAG